jgi:nucleoside-diphosphate-sugar epimerase
MRIAILGSNSHISKGLIWNFLKKTDHKLYLFTQASDKVKDFMGKNGLLGCKFIIEEGYQSFSEHNYDIIINCVGAGTPKKLGNNYSSWFILTEKFDNLIIEYLLKNNNALYVNFSSGAVYGKNLSRPVKEDTVSRISVNHVPPEDYYTIVRLNSEAKHRSFTELNIVDLRIFSYFSRFIDLSSGYLITEILNCLLNKLIFKTNNENILRDYIHPDDLFSLVMGCVQEENINSAFDAISLEPAEKFRILDFLSMEYGLKYEISDNVKPSSPNGAKNVYFSKYNKAAKIGYKPAFSSMDAIEHESAHILKATALE